MRAGFFLEALDRPRLEIFLKRVGLRLKSLLLHILAAAAASPVTALTPIPADRLRNRLVMDHFLDLLRSRFDVTRTSRRLIGSINELSKTFAADRRQIAFEKCHVSSAGRRSNALLAGNRPMF